MIFEKKHLQTLQQLKIKHSLDEFPLPSNFVYIDRYKCIFISSFKRNIYQILCSPACKLSFIDSQSLFNVLYTSNNLEECINEFHKYVKEIINCPA